MRKTLINKENTVELGKDFVPSPGYPGNYYPSSPRFWESSSEPQTHWVSTLPLRNSPLHFIVSGFFSFGDKVYVALADLKFIEIGLPLPLQCWDLKLCATIPDFSATWEIAFNQPSSFLPIRSLLVVNKCPLASTGKTGHQVKPASFLFLFFTAHYLTNDRKLSAKLFSDAVNGSRVCCSTSSIFAFSFVFFLLIPDLLDHLYVGLRCLHTV